MSSTADRIGGMVSTSPIRASPLRSPDMPVGTHGRTLNGSRSKHESSINGHSHTPKLRVLSGTEKGATFDLRPGRNLVGRSDDCVVQLGTTGISKHHAVIVFETSPEAACFVEDLGSTNKSLLGSLEEPVSLVPGQQYQLEHGDCVVFGDSACVFLWGAARTQSPQRSAASAHGMNRSIGSPLLHRPPTSASFVDGADQEAVLSQLETLMAGMNHLYSIVQGSPGDSRNSHYPSTPFPDESSSLDPSRTPKPAGLHVVASPARITTGMDRAGANLQGSGHSSRERRPPTHVDAPLPGLLRHAALDPERPPLTPSDMKHLYHGVSSSGRRPGASALGRTAHLPPSRQASASSTVWGEFGRFRLPEMCILNILWHTPRLPHLLTMMATSTYFRQACSREELWGVLDVSWDCLTPDPVCRLVTDEVLADLLERHYRTRLSRVELAGCQFVSDWTLLLLSRYCYKAVKIDLSCHADIGPAITDAGMVELARRVPALEELRLGWCQRIGNVSLSALAESSHNLTALDLTGCGLVSDLAVIQLADSQSGPKLRSVRLRSCALLTSDAVAGVAHRCTSLTRLDLAGCERVGGDSVVKLMHACTQLTNLDLTQCHLVGDAHLRAIATGFTRLSYLSLGYCRNVTDDGFKDMARFCRSLVRAELRGLRKITDASIIKLSQVALKLKRLDLRGCQALTREALDSVGRQLVSCELVFSHVS